MIKNDIRDIKLSSERMNFNKTIVKPESHIFDTRIKQNNSEKPITESIDLEKALKLLPPISDWPKFSGEGEYCHISFIK